MGSLSNKERARRALDAMKALGFSKKEAAPVLKSLLNIFDNSWEPIEDESYRALADAILDTRDRSQNNEEEGQEHHRHSTAAVPPLPDEDYNSFPTPLAMIGSSCDLDCETDETRIKRPSVDLRPPPYTMEKQDDTIMSISSLGASPESNRLQIRPSTRSRQSMEDGMPSSIPAHKKARQMMDEDFQHAVFLKEPKPEPDMEAIQYNASLPSCQNDQVGISSHPLNISSSSGAAHPLALLPPDQYTSKISGSKGRTVECCRTRASSSSFEEPMNTRMKQSQEQGNDLGHIAAMQKSGTGSSVKNTLEAPSLLTVVASSTTGEVKLSIKCSIDPSNFHMPDLEAVFKTVEDKYKMGSYCTGEDDIKADAVDNGRNRLTESMMHNALFMESIACMNSGSEKDQPVEESLVMEASESGLPNTTVTQQPHLALSLLRPIHDVSDISKGEEKCGNRVVQRGITCNLQRPDFTDTGSLNCCYFLILLTQVFFTQEGKGWGLRTLDELPKGAFVCEYVGELLTSTELHERTLQNMHHGRYMYPVLLDANWGSDAVLKDEEALCLDATFYGNVGRFINHRCCDANLVEIPVEVETSDRHYYHIAFFTTKKVEAFEELTWDYGIDFDDDKHPVKAFDECLCGSRYCRGRKHRRKRGKAGAK
ncbi:hypothetical protein PR202_ga18445 [Eleusine coracana subsp. coracana]|uniref:SET domain-containing protein n=1 Tax=Eleusine coracana subsp. coracana TaxID=191504 RepID=A0AAV5CRT8_ELECO|nr:hypothetical protein PR202_ga18445 [Eleusine coracana subsp. coracana]